MFQTFGDLRYGHSGVNSDYLWHNVNTVMHVLCVLLSKGLWCNDTDQTMHMQRKYSQLARPCGVVISHRSSGRGVGSLLSFPLCTAHLTFTGSPHPRYLRSTCCCLFLSLSRSRILSAVLVEPPASDWRERKREVAMQIITLPVQCTMYV